MLRESQSRDKVARSLTRIEDILQHADQAIEKPDDLLSIFYESETPNRDWRVGTEAEHFAISHLDGAPLQYGSTLFNIFDHFIQKRGWNAMQEFEGGPTIALHRGQSSITLEPGVQLELSGAPFANLCDGQDEWKSYRTEINAVSDPLKLQWLGLGCQPIASQHSLGWVPKSRYSIMRQYLVTRCAMALDMMLRTSTVQANLDYSSEEDAMRKLRAGTRLQPLVTAMFANSPWCDAQDSGYRSYRAFVWTNMDADRSGLLPFTWKDSLHYQDYVEWALDVPMFLIRRGDRFIQNTKQSFRMFMNEGLQGYRATSRDWEMHLATLFPEVRLKNTIEFRGADSQAEPMLFALPALWKGLLYDEQSLGRVEGLIDLWSYPEVEQSRERLARKGVQTDFMGRSAVDWAGDILEIAEEGLQRISETPIGFSTELELLKPLRELLSKARCPADILLEQIRPDIPLTQEIPRLVAL